MIASLDAHFHVCGGVKPGSITGSVTEAAKSDVEKLTMNDFLIVCSGTNDTDRNYSSNAFKNINNYIKSVNHTNIILISVSYRHDVMAYSHVNNMIKSFNSNVFFIYGSVHHNIFYEITNRCRYMQSILFQC